MQIMYTTCRTSFETLNINNLPREWERQNSSCCSSLY